MELEHFYLTRGRLIRLPGCAIYIPDDTARSGYRRLDGGRAVYLERDGDLTGLAVVNRQVVSVVTEEDRSVWRVIADDAEMDVA